MIARITLHVFLICLKMMKLIFIHGKNGKVNRKRYSNIFFNFGLFTRFVNKLFPRRFDSSFELLIKRRLKLVNYIRTASHLDVFKTLASLSLDSTSTKDEL